MRITRYLTTALLPALLTTGFASSALAQDPPDRVGRVSYVGGDVSFRPGDVDDWAAATLNYPLKSGDDLWADVGARAEIAIGSAAVRLAPTTAMGFLALDDQTTQLRLTQGSVQVRVRDLADDEIFEIDTPNGAVSLLLPGSYRVDVDGNGDETSVTVREGRAELTAAGSTFTVDDGEAGTLSGIDSPSYDINDPLPLDAWEQWGATICPATRISTTTAIGVKQPSTDRCGRRAASWPDGRRIATGTGRGWTRGAGRGSMTRPGASHRITTDGGFTSVAAGRGYRAMSWRARCTRPRWWLSWAAPTGASAWGSGGE
jgi:hypothetical protein